MAGVRQKRAGREQQQHAGCEACRLCTYQREGERGRRGGAAAGCGTRGRGSLLELGRASLAGKAAIGSATQGTRWVVQVRESCLREGKSERDWGKSETGGGGESIAAALGPVVPVAQFQLAQCQCRPHACRGCSDGGGRPLERAPRSPLNRRSRAWRGMGSWQQPRAALGRPLHRQRCRARCGEPVDTHIAPSRCAPTCQYALSRAAAGTSLITRSAILLGARAFSHHSPSARGTPPHSLLTSSALASILQCSCQTRHRAGDERCPRSRRHQHPRPARACIVVLKLLNTSPRALGRRHHLLIVVVRPQCCPVHSPSSCEAQRRGQSQRQTSNHRSCPPL